MTRVITKAETLAALKAAVALKGADYVYPADLKFNEVPGNERHLDTPACIYFDHRQNPPVPCCIVGHVFATLGIDPGLVEEFCSADQAVNEDAAGVEFEGDAMALLEQAQQYQDDGTPWGRSVAKAEEWVTAKDLPGWGGGDDD